jgi:hypothetical protein
MFESLRKRRLNRGFGRAFVGILPTPPGSDPVAADGHAHHPARDEGPEVYRLEADEPWYIRDDGLAERLGLRSNRAAESKVENDLKKHDPSLLARLEFDSEHDTFFAYAESEADALALRDYLLGLK